MKFSACLSTSPAQFEAVPFKGNFEENIAAIREMGFDGVELAIRDPRLIDEAMVLTAVRNAGLEIPAIGTGQAWGEEGLSFTDPEEAVREKAVERVMSHIPFARKAGAVIIIGLLRGMVRPGVNRDDAEAWMTGCFSRCCRAAEREGVRIAFEPINRYETSLLNGVEEGLDFIGRVGGSNLGMLLDTFHMNIEEPSIEDSILKAGDRIFHFHYADSNRWYPGAGHIRFEPIIKALRETGYTGFLSGEHRPDPEPEEAVRRGLDFMRKMIGEIE